MAGIKYCYKCGTEWEGVSQPGTNAACGKCRAELHVCLNCRFYDTHKPSACMIPDIDLVMRKDNRNFCEEFQFALRAVKPAAGDSRPSGVSGRDKFDKLFGK